MNRKSRNKYYSVKMRGLREVCVQDACAVLREYDKGDGVGAVKGLLGLYNSFRLVNEIITRAGSYHAIHSGTVNAGVSRGGVGVGSGVGLAPCGGGDILSGTDGDCLLDSRYKLNTEQKNAYHAMRFYCLFSAIADKLDDAIYNSLESAYYNQCCELAEVPMSDARAHAESAEITHNSASWFCGEGLKVNVA